MRSRVTSRSDSVLPGTMFSRIARYIVCRATPLWYSARVRKSRGLLRQPPAPRRVHLLPIMLAAGAGRQTAASLDIPLGGMVWYAQAPHRSAPAGVSLHGGTSPAHCACGTQELAGTA